MNNQLIDLELQLARRHGVYEEVLEWLGNAPRTWGELLAHDRGWAVCVATGMPLPDDVAAWLESQGCGRSWWRNDKLHRDNDMPAIVSAYGKQEWWKDGKRHRDGDMPATIRADGKQEWRRNGKRHRDGDMPAIIYADGTRSWWRDGKYIRTSAREGAREERKGLPET